MSDALAHKLSDFKPRETEAKHVINLYRFFSLIGALTYPVFYFIFKYAYPESHDSFLLRVIISAMCFGIFFLSFSEKIFINYLNKILYIISFSAVAHFTYLLWLNNFQVFYYIGFIMVVFIFSFTFKRLTDLWIFLIFSIISIAVSSFNLLDPRDASFYIFSSGLLFSVISILLSNKIQAEDETSLGTYLLESLYQESPDAIIIVEKKADKILRINKRALSLFNIDDEDIISEKKVYFLYTKTQIQKN